MSLKILQSRIGTKPDGAFGQNTAKAFMAFYKLTPEQTAHFFGQCAHETGTFVSFVENLNYSESGLLRVFPKYFSKKNAHEYAHEPMAIANKVYANRMGNGDEASGDGWRYRGRGAIQLTGKANYKEFADWLRKPIRPDEVSEDYAFDSARFFFERNGIWRICTDVSEDTIREVTRRINGGYNGIQDRIKKTQRYYEWLK